MRRTVGGGLLHELGAPGRMENFTPGRHVVCVVSRFVEASGPTPRCKHGAHPRCKHGAGGKAPKGARWANRMGEGDASHGPGGIIGRQTNSWLGQAALTLQSPAWKKVQSLRPRPWGVRTTFLGVPTARPLCGRGGFFLVPGFLVRNTLGWFSVVRRRGFLGWFSLSMVWLLVVGCWFLFFLLLWGFVFSLGGLENSCRP